MTLPANTQLFTRRLATCRNTFDGVAKVLASRRPGTLLSVTSVEIHALTAQRRPRYPRATAARAYRWKMVMAQTLHLSPQIGTIRRCRGRAFAPLALCRPRISSSPQRTASPEGSHCRELLASLLVAVQRGGPG